MSHDYYTEIWLVTRSDLEKLLELERKLQDTPLREKAALNSALSMYLKCVLKNIDFIKASHPAVIKMLNIVI